MTIPYPPAVSLTDEEKEYLALISFDSPTGGLSQERIHTSSSAAETLTQSLLNRQAIPKIRLRYFCDAELQIRIKKSPMQIYKERGFEVGEIFRHPGFIKFLRYFIYGPDLPTPVIFDFWQRVNSEEFISGSDLTELKTIARSAVRQNDLDPRRAGEEFYKLALECQLTIGYARYIRDVVRAMR